MFHHVLQGVPTSQLFCSLDDQKYIIWEYTMKSNKWKLKEWVFSAVLCPILLQSESYQTLFETCVLRAWLLLQLTACTGSVGCFTQSLCWSAELLTNSDPPLDRNNAARPVCPMQLNPKLLGVLGLDFTVAELASEQKMRSEVEFFMRFEE